MMDLSMMSSSSGREVEIETQERGGEGDKDKGQWG